MTERRRTSLTAIAAAVILFGCGADETAFPEAEPTTNLAISPSNSRAPTTAATLLTMPTASTVATTTTGPATTPNPTPATTSTTQWTPPSITWPTVPYTLPPDYGSGTACDNAAPPRTTHPNDTRLPTKEWTIQDALTIRFEPPDDFRQDPFGLPPVGACDRANGLYLLQRWAVVDEPILTGLSVQTNPGNDSPLLSRTEFSDTTVGTNLTWYLWNGETVRQTRKPPNRGLTVVGDYLFMIHGTPKSMEAIVDNLTIEPSSE